MWPFTRKPAPAEKMRQAFGDRRVARRWEPKRDVTPGRDPSTDILVGSILTPRTDGIFGVPAQGCAPSGVHHHGDTSSTGAPSIDSGSCGMAHHGGGFHGGSSH